jgi:serine/threonine-protein kinase RsbW
VVGAGRLVDEETELLGAGGGWAECPHEGSGARQNTSAPAAPIRVIRAPVILTGSTLAGRAARRHRRNQNNCWLSGLQGRTIGAHEPVGSMTARRLFRPSPILRGLKVKRTITVGPDALDNVQAALDAFWSRHDDVPAAVRIEVEIAVTEIAANILEHGCAGELQMEMAVHADEVHVEFTDSGDPAEVDLFMVRMPDAMAERGRGLAIAPAALRVLAYFRDELGNHWRLVSKAFGESR